MEYAFGVQPYLQPWASARGAATLLATTNFVVDLNRVLNDLENTFAWQLQGLNVAVVRGRAGYFDMGDLGRCQFTNWEYLTFYVRQELWPRTTWWRDITQVDNPMENGL